MSQLYDRAEIYDLIENEKRTESIRREWKQFLGEREIHSLLENCTTSLIRIAAV